MASHTVSRADRAVAARTTSPHIRYQGCTTGPRTTPASRASPTERTTRCPPGPWPRSSSQADSPAAAAAPASRPTVISPSRPKGRPAVTLSAATSMARPVGRDSQVRTVPGVPRANSQPKPSPEARVSTVNAAPVTAPAARRPRSSRRRPVSRWLHRTPMTATTSSAGAFTVTLSAATAELATCAPSRASAIAAMASPSISASLCAPLTKCSSTSGLRTPSHRARLGSAPSSSATRGR